MRVVVVGSGLAGLLAAREAADAGAEVLLVTKGALADANTTRAQGGIAAAVFSDDSVASHVRDTLAAGAGLCDPEAVEVLCAEGPDRVRDLMRRGVRFDRDGSRAANAGAGAGGSRGGSADSSGGGSDLGEAGLARGLEAAHSIARVLHAGGDATGAEIERALVAALADSPRVTVLEHTALIELVIESVYDGPRVVGIELAQGVDSDQVGARGGNSGSGHVGASGGRGSSGHVGASGSSGSSRHAAGTDADAGADARTVEYADAVVLATGGAGQLFAHTTNPAVATGDGVAAAWRAGAAIADAEFYQFHPTALAAPGSFLVSEAVRGEGAVLRNARGERFMVEAHPAAELAPRDVVARVIATEMAAQDGEPVVLDATGLGASVLARRFPTIDAATRAAGFDWAREPIPVTPAAHYWMGGIATDASGRTDLPGLWAVGECASTGVHGGNRLASNSLLEAAVFAHRAVADVLTGAAAPSGHYHPASATRIRVAHPGSWWPTRSEEAARTGGRGDRLDRSALQRLMWTYAGVQRSGEGLRHAASVLASWSAADGEDRNLLDLARVVVDFALAREESRGAHYRSDFPLPRAEFERRMVRSRSGHPTRLREGASVC